MTTKPTNDTAARDARRKERAVAWLELWRAEREKAQRERRPMRYVGYDYQENDDADATKPLS